MLSHLPLGQGLFPVQAVAQGQYLLLPVVQDLPHVLPEQSHVLPAADPVEHVVILTDHIHEGQSGAVLAGFDVVGQGDVRSAFPLASEVHEDFVLHAPGRIGGQPDAFARIKGGHGLNEPDGADGYEVLLVRGLGVVFFHNMGHQTQVAFNEDIARLQIPSCSLFQVFLLLFCGQGLGKAAGAEAEGIEHTAQHENRRSRDHFLTSCQPVYSRQQVPMYAKGQQHLLFTDR